MIAGQSDDFRFCGISFPDCRSAADFRYFFTAAVWGAIQKTFKDGLNQRLNPCLKP